MDVFNINIPNDIREQIKILSENDALCGDLMLKENRQHHSFKAAIAREALRLGLQQLNIIYQ